jgi:hypothetical protein
MLRNFLVTNILFEKDKISNSLVVTGEITNKTGKDYSAVVFRVIVFIREKPMGHTMMTLNGFSNGETKMFAKLVREVDFRKITQSARCEIIAESAY